jgi:uncharacterized protein YfaS (alpha-2-macroglobulin family)
MQGKSLLISGVGLILIFFMAMCTTDASPVLGSGSMKEFSEAEEVFGKEKYEEALQLYERISAAETSEEIRYKSLYRQVECLAYLFRYGKAVEKLRKIELPKDIQLKFWILIAKAEILENFLNQYSYILRPDLIEGAEDIFNLTQAEIKQEIMAAYIPLWEERETLLGISLEKQVFFVELDKINFHNLPSLCDYLVLSFSRYLLEQEDKTTSLAQIQSIIGDNFTHEVDFTDPPLLLTASLRQALSNAHGLKQSQAREYWQIQRLLSPFQNFPNRFLDHYKELRGQEKKILLSWLSGFSTEESKAEAGYRGAEILNEEQNYLPAVELCSRIEKEFTQSEGASLAKSLRLKIQLPYLYLQTGNTLPTKLRAVNLYARNITNLFLRIYKTDLENMMFNYGIATKWPELVRYVNENWIYEEFLPGKKPAREWQIELASEKPYQPINRQVELPKIDPGAYVIIASNDRNFTKGSSLITACIVNVTDIMLIGSLGRTTETLTAYNRYLHENGPEQIEDQIARIYTLDAHTGAPVKGVDVALHYQLNGYSRKWDLIRSSSSQDGSVGLKLLFDFNGRSEWGYLYPMARKANSFAYWNNQIYFSNYLPSPLELFIQTDRPIYRPGQNVSAKVIALKRTAQGFRSLDDSYTVDLYARDANGKVFFEKSLTLSQFGSGDVNFTIPQGRLLGVYSLDAHCSKDRLYGSGAVNFNVEEYKRPEFEVNMKKTQEAWLYDKEAKVEGNVCYYFGAAVSNATVTYRIKRQFFVPWYYRYWYAAYVNNAEQEVAWGQVQADEQGNFKFSFVPTKNENTFATYLRGKLPDISSFNIYVEARDAGGRTISTSATYMASECGFYLTLEGEKGFFHDHEEIVIKTEKLTVNDTPLSGTGRYELYRLKDEPAKTYEDLGNNYHSYDGTFNQVPPLDIQLTQVASGSLTVSGNLSFDESGKNFLKLSPLSPGLYRLYVHAGENNKEVIQEAIIVVIPRSGKNMNLKVTSVLLSDKKEYEAGDDALFVMGSGCSAGNYFIEIYKGDFLFKRDYLKVAPGATTYQLKIPEGLKGGFTLRWFSVADMQVYHAQAFIPIPEKDKKLDVAFTSFQNELAPGEKATWEIKVSDYRAKPVRGEVLALMYDRSLEYYSQRACPWLDGLYGIKIDPQAAVDATFLIYGNQFSITSGALFVMREEAHKNALLYSLPYLRFWRTWARGRDFERSSFGLATGEVSKSELKNDKLLDEASVKEKSPLAGYVSPEGEKQITARKNFSETAFFLPYIKTDDKGKASFSFTAPEQLTGWRVKLFAFTKEASEGVLTEEVVTKKDLMVRIDIPRFFREKDEGTFTVFVHNESDKTLTGRLAVTVSENEKIIHQKIKLSDTEKSFTILPHKVQSFDWTLAIPAGVGTYAVKAEAKTATLADAEQRELPILPSRERLIESICVALSGTEKKTLRFALGPDPTRINESMHLQIDPQLALSLLNTIPFLVQYPYECVEQILNKYVPLGIMHQIYEKYPNLKKAVAKIPQRHTVTPEWEKDDPRRQLSLLETPWMWEAEGQPSSYPVIDMLNPEVVAAQKEYVLERLKNAQLGNGAFPWWPGGRQDLYITLYVLAGFAEARSYGVEVPTDMISRALSFVTSTIPTILKAEEGNLALISYAAYVISSYPGNDFYEARKAREYLPAWLKFVDEHRHALTPLGKAYLALSLFRTGNKERAREILDTIMDSAREDSLVGVYWTPEKYSWVWYSDTVEKHAFMIRVLAEMSPEDKRIPGLVQWLLWGRKGNVWKSTKASAQAVYSLLDFLKTRGVLDTDESFKISWGGTEEKITLKADEWLEKPLRYSQTAQEITPASEQAVIDKQGNGIAFASMVWIYSTDQLPEASAPGLLTIERTFYKRVKEGEVYHLKPLASGSKVAVGDQIEVKLKINAQSQFEYLHLKDPKAAGLEAETLTSGWKYDPLWYYEEPRDSLTNFFFGWLPHGEYILRYRLRPTKAGKYRIGAAVLQSMYAPEMSAHSSGFVIAVE